MKILVTGGAGFIGSHVTELLCDEGYEVTVIDDLSSGVREFVDKRAKFIRGSLANRKLLDKVLLGQDAVFHLAASTIIKYSFDNPKSFFDNNLMNGINLLESMRKNKVKKIVYSSTAAVYGQPRSMPIKEGDPREPVNIYGASKLALENSLSAYYHSFGINSVSLRYFNAYGPRDEMKKLPTRAVPIWVKALIRNRPLPLYWNGEQKRDYIFVGDIARAHLAVLGLKGLHFYNIGTGKGVWMKDILKNLEEISKKKAIIKNIKERAGDVKELIADISKIKKEVGWKPKVPLKEGLKKTFDYYQSVWRTTG